MIAIVTDTFVTSMQPNPSKPYLSRGTHLLIKTASIGSSHMGSYIGFSCALLSVSLHFTIELFLFVASEVFLH